jgi:hypothetical protein
MTLPTDPVPDFPDKWSPHRRSDGAACCVQCGKLLIHPDGTIEREHRKVTSRLTMPPQAMAIPRGHPAYGSGAVAYKTGNPVVCDDNLTCIQECQLDKRWLKANAKGDYESHILLVGK